MVNKQSEQKQQQTNERNQKQKEIKLSCLDCVVPENIGPCHPQALGGGGGGWVGCTSQNFNG